MAYNEIVVRNAIVIIILTLTAVGVGLYIASEYLFFGLSFDGLKPRFTAPRKDIKQYLPVGSDLSYPLTIPRGFRMGVFADLKGGLPRVLALDPKGVLVISVTNKGKIMALPDEDGDGASNKQIDILTNLDEPHGIIFDGGYLYVAETGRVSRFIYNPTNFSASSREILFSLPSGGQHSTRTIKIRGGALYTSVGSSCDVCIEEEPFRAAILVSALDGANLKVFAKGLRNTVFFDFDSEGRIWGADMGRDFLGDSFPPDEINLIEEGKDYGWPYCYGDRVRDSKFKPGEESVYCSGTIAPKFNLPAHVAPLGITFIDSASLPSSDKGNILVSLHGSWNSTTAVGYKVVKLTTFGGDILGSENFIAGWQLGQETLGRPVDLIFDSDGNLFVSDDHAGLIYILSKS